MVSPNPATRRDHSGNAVQTTIVGTIASDALSFELTDPTGWPDGGVGPFVATLDAGTASEEKINCESRTGAAVTVATGGRGFDGSTASAHTGGSATAMHTISAVELDELNAHAAATSGVHGAAGTIVGTSDSQTLTNKTMSGASNTFSNIPKASITGAPSGTLVGTSDSQTLTNKTMDGGSNTFTNILPSSIVGGHFYTSSAYTTAGTEAYADPGAFFTTFRFTCVGGGGGGGGGGTAGVSGGGGGGAATNIVVLDRADLTFPLELVIPAGGTGGTGGASATNGGNGPAATVKNSGGAGSTVASAAGGSGGNLASSGDGSGGAGGSTGTGTGVLKAGQAGEAGAGTDATIAGGSAFAPFDRGRKITGQNGTTGKLGGGGGGGAPFGSYSGGAGGPGFIMVEAW